MFHQRGPSFDWFANPERLERMPRGLRIVLFTGAVWIVLAAHARADDGAAVSRGLDAWGLLEAGGTIGWIIMAISVWMIALLIQHLISLRTPVLMPPGLAEQVHNLIAEGRYPEAQQVCRANPSFLSSVLDAGLVETPLGYSAVEKALEDASQQHAARLFRGLEYYTVIGTIAPMLGLLGTVWGMILAFMEFEMKTNPQVSELAPGIYKALVTTLQGLCVAIPALAIYALLRNRVDELVAQTSLMAEHVFSGFKRLKAQSRRMPVAGGKPRPVAEAGDSRVEAPGEPE